MSICGGCGYPIDFRYIDGRCVPLGCRCYGAGYRDRGRVVNPARPWTSGLGVVPWPVTYRTRCFWCPQEVFYHTNGYGDCVLLDDLGPPWPVPPCWQEYRDERRRAIVTCTGVLVNSGVEIVREPALKSGVDVVVPREDWWHFGSNDDPRQWLRRLEYELVYTLKPPPVPPDPHQRGPFLIMTWVVTHADRYFFTTDLPRTDTAWVAVDTASKDLVVFVPEEIRRQLKAGDPFIAEIQAVGEGSRCEYVAVRIRGKDSGRIDIL